MRHVVLVLTLLFVFAMPPSAITGNSTPEQQKEMASGTEGLNALREVLFTPTRSQGRAVGVRVAIPIAFRLQ